MGHPDISNETPFAFEPLFVQNENGRPTLTPIVRATYAIGQDGGLELAEEQPPVNFVGERYGDDEQSSFRYEPETAFVKPATDVVLIAHAHAPAPRTTEVTVGLKFGALQHAVRVVGDRQWQKRLIGSSISDPQPFETIPLLWERAYGGWDTSPDDPAKHGWEPRNPIGVGFHVKGSKLVEGAPLPNLEDPSAPLTKYAGNSNPAGFGFVSPNWEPRASLAGTYDDAWQKSRAPMLPVDFQTAHFNAAPEPLISTERLTGHERVIVTNASPTRRLEFELPGLQNPECLIGIRGASDRTVACELDTVIVNLDDMQLTLLWRTVVELRDGPLDLQSLRVRCANAPHGPTEPRMPDNLVPLFPDQASNGATGA